MGRTGPKSTHTMVDHGWKAIHKNLKKMDKAFVEVGVFEGDSHNDPEGGSTPMAMIAAVQEYGSTVHNIPERSFLRSWVNEKQEQIDTLTASLYKAVSSGKMAVNEAMKKLGAFASSGIRAQIRAGDFAPLQPATIARKKSSRPLIDTGQLINSIHYRTGSGNSGEGEQA